MTGLHALTNLMSIGDSGITSTNNSYYGYGRWNSYLSPSTWYTSLSSFQLASGFEVGSTMNEKGGAGDTLSIFSGNGVTQSILSHITLTAQTDSSGILKTGHPVTWAVSSVPAGSWQHAISVTADTTDEFGQSSTILTIGHKVGNYVITCTSNEGLAGSPLTFTVTAVRNRSVLFQRN